MYQGHLDNVRILNPKRRKTLTPFEHPLSEYNRKKETENVKKIVINFRAIFSVILYLQVNCYNQIFSSLMYRLPLKLQKLQLQLVLILIL